MATEAQTVTIEKRQLGHPTWFAASRKGTVSLEQMKPADWEVNRQHHMQEVQPGTAAGHWKGWAPGRVHFSPLSDTDPHG